MRKLSEHVKSRVLVCIVIILDDKCAKILQLFQAIDFSFRASHQQNVEPVVSELLLGQARETDFVSSSRLHCEIAQDQCRFILQRLNLRRWSAS